MTGGAPNTFTSSTVLNVTQPFEYIAFYVATLNESVGLEFNVSAINGGVSTSDAISPIDNELIRINNTQVVTENGDTNVVGTVSVDSRNVDGVMIGLQGLFHGFEGKEGNFTLATSYLGSDGFGLQGSRGQFDNMSKLTFTIQQPIAKRGGILTLEHRFRDITTPIVDTVFWGPTVMVKPRQSVAEELPALLSLMNTPDVLYLKEEKRGYDCIALGTATPSVSIVKVKGGREKDLDAAVVMRNGMMLGKSVTFTNGKEDRGTYICRLVSFYMS